MHGTPTRLLGTNVFINNAPMRTNQATADYVAIQIYNKIHPQVTTSFIILLVHEKKLVVDDNGISKTTFIDRATHAPTKSRTVPTPAIMQCRAKLLPKQQDNSAKSDTE